MFYNQRNLELLRELAEKNNIEYIERANGHIQLKGQLLVNYYPLSRNRCAYVAGTTKGVKHCAFEDAISMTMTAPPKLSKTEQAKRGANSRIKRKKLFDKGLDSCFWCKKELTLDASTLEHKIPLARGGLDNANNRTLACFDCNQDRGSDMPELSNDNYV